LREAVHALADWYVWLIYPGPSREQDFHAELPNGTLNHCVQFKEIDMRLTMIAVVALAGLLATTAATLACPQGYVSCGNFCCPKR
jgi:hypothetical protein